MEEKISPNIAEDKKKKIKQKKSYFFLKDKIFIWTIISFIMVFFLVINLLNIKYLTTIYSYTFGLFFGMFSIAIFIFIILLSLKNIFKLQNTYSAGVFHFSLWRLGLLLFIFMILGTSIYYVKFQPESYNYKNAFFAILEKWYQLFKTNNALLPNKWTPGLFFSFIYVLISFPGSKIGIVLSFLISTILLLISISLFFISNNTLKKIFIRKSKEKKQMTASNNINVNLEKEDLFEQTKDSILINNQNIKNIDFKDTTKNSPNFEIDIDPEKLDFSDRDFEILDLNNYQDNKESNKKSNENEDSNINEIDIESQDFSYADNNQKINNLNSEKKQITSNIDLFSNDEIDFSNENVNENNKENANTKNKRFSIIEDKEELF